MTPKKLVLAALPISLMTGAASLLLGREAAFADLGWSRQSFEILGKAGLAAPFVCAAIIGLLALFSAAGSISVKWTAGGVALAAIAMAVYGFSYEAMRLLALSARVGEQEVLTFADPFSLGGSALCVVVAIFALRVLALGNAAFARATPRRISGKRAIHGEADWMTMSAAAKLLPDRDGMIVGERYRVDCDSTASIGFEGANRDSWGRGGRAVLLRFDAGFGSGHGLAFAGSGGFKTTSVTIPNALHWSGSLVVLDPSNEIAPMVSDHRRSLNRQVHVLDPRTPQSGFNVLDWIGRFGGSIEEDIAAVAAWLMTDSGRIDAGRIDFFRGSAQQLITALIADVCLSGHTEEAQKTLRQVRANLAEPEPKLRTRLQEIHDSSQSAFVRENVAPFINMTPETFSGIYGAAAKETHWLSYENYAALVSGSAFTTDRLADGTTDLFINLDLKTLENHPGLARVVIGSLLNAVYNRNGAIAGRTLFLLDEVARLGFMRILETARDAGRKYGISLLMLFQSIGQMREAYGGRDATSKWFESVSWVSFAAINDPETAEYISRRCGDTTVEVDQTSTTSRMGGASRTRSRQLTRRALILPHEVLHMRGDEQIVFTAGNAPLRCGRAIFFRRKDMVAITRPNRFGPNAAA